MYEKLQFENFVFKRAFFLSTENIEFLRDKLSLTKFASHFEALDNINFFDARIWFDSSLRFEAVMEGDYGVAIFGLVVNPFSGMKSSGEIAKHLLGKLLNSKALFLDSVDELSGSFLILYKTLSGMFLLQDAVATKPIYYFKSNSNKITVSSHSKLVSEIYHLEVDDRVNIVRTNLEYAKDPSKYLPALITPFKGLLPLTANTELSIQDATVSRFFPREALVMRDFDDILVDDIAAIFKSQAKLIADLERPIMLAATGGKDSRTSAAFFDRSKHLKYFSFSMPSSGHLVDDVLIAKKLSVKKCIPISTFSLENYANSNFDSVFEYRSPLGVWPAAALCYLNEFPDNAIHIRSTVSEVGRCFYPVDSNGSDVSPEVLASTYTLTNFKSNPMLISAMDDFINKVSFRRVNFFNYNMFDFFYWEHRNSKWQNILCHEAEMASDVFIPFNNRKLLKLFLSVPFAVRRSAAVHLALISKYGPEFDGIEYC